MPEPIKKDEADRNVSDIFILGNKEQTWEYSKLAKKIKFKE